MRRLLFGLVLTALLVVSSACWAMDVADYRKLSEAVQIVYVAGVVDSLYQHTIVRLHNDHPEWTLADFKNVPLLRCIENTSYGSFHSVTRDLLRANPGEPDDAIALVIVKATVKLCP